MTNSHPQRRETSVSLSDALLRQAQELGVDLSQACERGLAAEVQAASRQRWLAENQAAIQAWNDHVAEHGLPLASHRQF